MTTVENTTGGTGSIATNCRFPVRMVASPAAVAVVGVAEALHGGGVVNDYVKGIQRSKLAGAFTHG